MHQAEEVEAHGRRQSTDHHAGEDEAVLVGLMMRSQVVEVQETDLQHGRVRAVEHVRDTQRRYRLEWRELVVEKVDKT